MATDEATAGTRVLETVHGPEPGYATEHAWIPQYVSADDGRTATSEIHGYGSEKGMVLIRSRT